MKRSIAPRNIVFVPSVAPASAIAGAWAIEAAMPTARAEPSGLVGATGGGMGFEGPTMGSGVGVGAAVGVGVGLGVGVGVGRGVGGSVIVGNGVGVGRGRAVTGADVLA